MYLSSKVLLNLDVCACRGDRGQCNKIQRLEHHVFDFENKKMFQMTYNCAANLSITDGAISIQ